jgi:hypothetical protein
MQLKSAWIIAASSSADLFLPGALRPIQKSASRVRLQLDRENGQSILTRAITVIEMSIVSVTLDTSSLPNDHPINSIFIPK